RALGLEGVDRRLGAGLPGLLPRRVRLRRFARLLEHRGEELLEELVAQDDEAPALLQVELDQRRGTRRRQARRGRRLALLAEHARGRDLPAARRGRDAALV